MTPHASGLHVLPQAGFSESLRAPEFDLTPALIRQIFVLLRKSYELVVIDLGHAFCEAQIEAGTKPQLQVIHLLTQPDAGWQGEKGRLDREKIQRLCGNRLTTSTFFLCCPPPMTMGLVQILAELGVPDSRISFEHFSL